MSDLLLWTSSINDKCLKENAENIFIPSGVKIGDKKRAFRNYKFKINSSISTVDSVKLVLLIDVENLNWVEETIVQDTDERKIFHCTS